MLARGTTVRTEPAPKPPAVNPVARPRRSGNHFSALPTVAPKIGPAPMPATNAATYKRVRELAMELITQAIATSTPLPHTMNLGPKRSIK